MRSKRSRVPIKLRWDYREFLRAEIKTRNKSLVEVAKQIDVSQAFLSQVLAHKRGLSEDKALQIAQNLRFDAGKAEYFQTLVRYGNARSEVLRTKLEHELAFQSGSKSNNKRLGAEVFAAIANWYHGAIVELLKIEGFQDCPKWIAKRLKIQPFEAELAVNRLIRLGILKRVDGKLAASDEKNINFGNVPFRAVRAYHQQILKLASAAIEKQTFADRDLRNRTLAVTSEQIVEIRQMIDRFLGAVAQRKKSDVCTSLYQLSVQLFRLDVKPVELLNSRSQIDE